MNRNKKIIGLVLFAVILTLLVSISSISKLTKRVLNDVTNSESNNTITASFTYKDSDGNNVHDNEKLYVFISEEENVGGNFIGVELEANGKSKTISSLYDQNATSNNQKIENKEYKVIVAKLKKDKENEFTEGKKYDQNIYDVYNSGDKYNGSYTITFPEKIEFNGKDSFEFKIEIKSLEGDKISLEEMLNPLELSTSFGVFALKFSQSADIEATIGVQTFEKNVDQTFGLSDRNYKPLKEYKSTGNISVSKKYTKNPDIPVSNKQVTINFKDQENKLTSKNCTTNLDGECSVIFDNLANGTYSVSETIDGQEVDTNKTITTIDGNSITVTFSNNKDIKIEGYSELQEILYNYNYVEKVGVDEKQVHLEKIRKPGTLVLGSQELYEKYKNNQEFTMEGENNKVTLGVAGSDSYKKIEFEKEFEELEKLSVKLSKAIDSNDIKVYHLTASQIKESGIDFNSDKKDYILVNVDCSNETEVQIGGRNKRDGKDLVTEDDSFVYNDGVKIIYNFYTKNNGEIKPFDQNLEILDATTGVILAPAAEVEGANGNHSGTIIAKEYNHTKGEVHQKVKPKWLSKDTKTTATITNNLTEKEEHKEQKIEIAKVDANSNPIEGAELQLLDKSGKEIEKWTSTKETHKVEYELKNGEEYTIHELTAPEGYQLARDYTFTYNGQEVQTYSMVDTQVIVNKYDETKQSLVGAQLQILDSKGTVIEEWISDGNLHVVEQKLVDGQTYYLREKQAPQGYKKAKDVKFVFNADGNNQTVNMEDQKIVLGIFVEKIDWNKKELPGAQLQILDSTGNIVESWTSDGSVYRVKSKLNIGEKYTLHEESAPEGYELSKDVEFVVKDTEDSQIITMVDNKIIIKGEPFVKIYKTDKYGSLLSGAELQLLDSNGNVIEEWISNDQAHIVDVKLQVGKKYTLHEVSAPKGYEVSDDITFTAKADEQEIKMTDERIRKVAGVVETLDNIAKYFVIFIVAITAVVLGFISIIKINKKKLSK